MASLSASLLLNCGLVLMSATHFDIHIILGEEVAQIIGNFDALCHFYQHAFFDTVLNQCFFIVNEHKAAVAFTQETITVANSVSRPFTWLSVPMHTFKR